MYRGKLVLDASCILRWRMLLDHVQQLQIDIVEEEQFIKYRQSKKTISKEETISRYDNINRYIDTIKATLARLKYEISLDLIILSKNHLKSSSPRAVSDLALLAPLPMGYCQ